MLKQAIESIIFNSEIGKIKGFAKVELNLDAKIKGDKIVFKTENGNLKMSIKQVEHDEKGEPQFKIKLKNICNNGEIIKDKKIAKLTMLSHDFKWLAIDNLHLDDEMIFA